MEKCVCCGQRQSLSSSAFNLRSLWAWIPARAISSSDSLLTGPVSFADGSQHTYVSRVCHVCQISLYLALGSLAFDQQSPQISI